MIFRGVTTVRTSEYVRLMIGSTSLIPNVPRVTMDA